MNGEFATHLDVAGERGRRGLTQARSGQAMSSQERLSRHLRHESWQGSNPRNRSARFEQTRNEREHGSDLGTNHLERS